MQLRVKAELQLEVVVVVAAARVDRVAGDDTLCLLVMCRSQWVFLYRMQDSQRQA